MYNGVDSSIFRRYPKNHPKVEKLLDELSFKGPTILCNGRFVPQKGQRYLMQALSLISEGGNMPNLLLLGKGPMEHDAQAHRRRTGHKPADPLRSGGGQTALLLLCMRRYGCAVALRAGIPGRPGEHVLRASRHSIKDGWPPRDGGQMRHLHRAQGLESIAAALSDVLSDPKKAAAMGRAGRKSRNKGAFLGQDSKEV